MSLIEWTLESKENIFALLIALGAMLESLNALFPSKDKTSLLEKLGKLVSKITNKLPSVKKK